jgi:NEDD8-activating enzyme E1
MSTYLSRPSPFGNETGPLACGEYEPLDPSFLLRAKKNDAKGEKCISWDGTKFGNKKILVIGAGGLGCEILKDLAMSGGFFRDVHVIDLDTIDVTVGSSKATTAANFINNRCPWMNVVPYHCTIQDKDPTFYKQFDIIISGLDNIEARRWLNATIVGLVEYDEDGDIDPTSVIPIVDGGTEGFSGQARFILPKITSCFECTIDSFPPATTFPLCTIAETPRKPEHCIAYAYILEWPKHFPDTKLDKDSPIHMRWVYEKALERSQKYNIPGVTYMLTMGVVKVRCWNFYDIYSWI